MIKVKVSQAQVEILFWEVLFWLMKGLQYLRNSWMAFLVHIRPSIRKHLTLLILVGMLGFGMGFAIGYLRIRFSGQ